MKITNEVNSNSDFLSVSNKKDDNTSLLGSLFSVSIESNEVKSNNISDDSEFTFKEEEIEIINYLYNFFPNLNLANLDSADLKRVNDEIKSDQSLKTGLKDKLLNFLKLEKSLNKSISINLSENHQLKVLNKNKIVHHKANSTTINQSSKALPPPLMKSSEQTIASSGEKYFNSNFINKNSSEIKKSELELDNQSRLNFNEKIDWTYGSLGNLNFNQKINRKYGSLGNLDFLVVFKLHFN